MHGARSLQCLEPVEDEAGSSTRETAHGHPGFYLPQPQKDRINLAAVEAGATSGSAAGLQGALEAARQANVVAFFFSPQVPQSKSFWEELERTTFWQRQKQKAITAVVDVSRHSQDQYRFAALRVPCVLTVAPDGNIVSRSFRLDDLK